MPDGPRVGEAIYFTDASGVQYRVLDARMHDGKMVVANPLASWATYRVFRSAEGMRRLYLFKPGEPRAPDGAGTRAAAAHGRMAASRAIATSRSGSTMSDEREIPIELLRAINVQIRSETLFVEQADTPDAIQRKQARIDGLRSWASNLRDDVLRRAYLDALEGPAQSIERWHNWRRIGERATAIELPSLPPELR